MYYTGRLHANLIHADNRGGWIISSGDLKNIFLKSHFNYCEVVDSYSGSSPSTASMHPYTVALIVLGIIALFIVLALVVFAFLTNTFCFATRGEPREERGGKVGKRDQVDKGGKGEVNS